jgi:hypothetical protein
LGVHAVFERFVVVGVAWVVECFAEPGCGHFGVCCFLEGM